MERDNLYCGTGTCKFRDAGGGYCLFGSTPEYRDFNRLPGIVVCKQRQDYEQWLASLDTPPEGEDV